MNILLINPSLLHEQVGHYNSRVEKSRGIYPSLGLLSVAAALEKAGHCVEVIDIDTETNPDKKIISSLQSHKPEVAGIHVMTWTFHQANQIAKTVKQINPSVIVIAGGAAVTSSPEALMRHSVFDYGVIGEGEKTAVELIHALGSKQNTSGIPGIIMRNGNQLFQAQERLLLTNLDVLPLPARHLIKINRYFDSLTKESSSATMITSRGCPYNCLYCDRKNRMGNTWRSFSNQRIVDEITELINRYAVKEIMFFDDEFIIDRRKTMDLCHMLIEKKLKFIWECRCRVDAVDRELLALMKKAGCYRIRFGFESGDDEILRGLKKGISVKQSLECSRLAKEAGIQIFGYFMFGCPGETKESINKTIDLIFAIDPDFAVLSKVILIPGSELFDWAAAQKIIAPDYWERFFAGEINNTAPCLSSAELSGETIDALIRKTNKKFYLRPKFALRALRNTGSVKQLWRQTRMGYNFIRGS